MPTPSLCALQMFWPQMFTHLQRSSVAAGRPLLAMPLLLAACVLSACGSAPQAPQVDESTRRPVNSAQAIELQVCQSELHNTRLSAQEDAQSAAAARAAAETLAVQQAWTAQAVRTQADAAGTAAKGNDTAAATNAVYTIPFAFGSTHIQLPAADAARLLDAARAAPLILLRGRTDGRSSHSAAEISANGAADLTIESHIARARAAAVRAYLVQAGVSPSRIRSTWQPTGDPVADNTTAAGRARNRRVEIELYRQLPQRMTLGTDTPPTATAAVHAAEPTSEVHDD